MEIKLDELLPISGDSYSYSGSLTTPPCTEAVRWLVVVEPAQLSERHLLAFSSKLNGINRPVQARNGRVVRRTTIRNETD